MGWLHDVGRPKPIKSEAPMGDQVWHETGRLFAFLMALVTLAALATLVVPW